MPDHTAPIQILNKVSQAVEFAVNTCHSAIHQFGRCPHFPNVAALSSVRLLKATSHLARSSAVLTIPKYEGNSCCHTRRSFSTTPLRMSNRKRDPSRFPSIHYASRCHASRSENTLLHEVPIPQTGYLFDSYAEQQVAGIAVCRSLSRGKQEWRATNPASAVWRLCATMASRRIHPPAFWMPDVCDSR